MGQQRWAVMTVPERQAKYRGLLIQNIVGLILLGAIFGYFMHDYIAWSRLAQQYHHATQADAREVPMQVT